MFPCPSLSFKKGYDTAYKAVVRGGVDGGCFISSALSQAQCRHQAMIRMPWAWR